MSTAFVTTVTKSYIPLARVLMASVAEHHPDAERYVMILDGGDEVAHAIPHATVLRPSDVLSDETELTVQQTIYAPIEYATALKPRILAQLLDSVDEAFFVDPDMRLFQPVTAALELLRTGTGTLLTPHRLTPPAYSDRVLYEWLFKAYGTYNTAFVGVTKASLPMLEWWDSRLRRDCLAALDKSEWVDQKIMDLAPGYFDIDILRDHGYNVCWWNLEERPVRRDGDTWFAGPGPLVVMHYSGVRPMSAAQPSLGDSKLPYLVHTAENSIASDDRHLAAIRELEAQYVADMTSAGYDEFKSTRYGFAATQGGHPLSQGDRRGYLALVLAAESEGKTPPLPDDISWSGPARIKRVARTLTFPGAMLRDSRQKAWKTA